MGGLLSDSRYSTTQPLVTNTVFPSENCFSQVVYLAHLVTSNLFARTCNKIDLTYNSHEQGTPFRKGKGFWEQKPRTTTHHTPDSPLGRRDAQSSCNARVKGTPESQRPLGFLLLTIADKDSARKQTGLHQVSKQLLTRKRTVSTKARPHRHSAAAHHPRPTLPT